MRDQLTDEASDLIAALRDENSRLRKELAAALQRAQESERDAARAKNLLERSKAQLAHTYDWSYEKGREFLQMRSECAALKAELARLQAAPCSKADKKA